MNRTRPAPCAAPAPAGSSAAAAALARAVSRPLRAARLLGCALLVAAPGCREEPPPAEAPRPRPVTVVALADVDPTGDVQLTGSVESWKEQDVAFEVGGRVAFVVEMATNLPGADGASRTGADNVLARLDLREYQITRDAAEAAVEVAAQQLRLAEVEREEVLPADVRSAEASRNLAQVEFERFQQAAERNAVSKLDALRKGAERDRAQAELDRAQARLVSKGAEIESLKAQLQEAREQLTRASYDLDRCVLPAPFQGEISEVYVEAGGTVRANQPVAHLVMMDPIKIDLALSSAMADDVRVGDRITIFPDGSDAPVQAFVYEKATVADPATRTFRVSIMARNGRRRAGLPLGDPRLALPAIPQCMFLTARDADDLETGPWGVEANRALRRDGEGWFVWGSDEAPDGGDLDPDDPVVTLRRYRVEPTDEVIDVQGLYSFRILADVGALSRDTLIALDVPDDFEEGGRVLVAREEWRLRPGQIVPVVLDAEPPPAGLYVPMSAVLPTVDGEGVVFVVEDEKANRVPVRLSGTVGDRVRIEPKAADGGAALLQPGARLVVDYLHFLVDGEPVRVVKTREVRS
ncbi:MAG: efflux RND transporter periplasmic adaptor subunit [Planctomycetota bacterium JB042]